MRACLRHSVRFAVAIAGVLLLVGCTSGASGGGTSTVPVPAPSRAGVPEGLEPFYGQQLDWTGCQDFVTDENQASAYGSSQVECARLTVPLDYDDVGPAAPTVTLGVLRRPALRPDQRIGTALVVPGEDGRGMDAASIAGGNGRVLGNRFDVVGFDRRGLGDSEPAISCLTAAEVDRARSTTTRTRTDDEVAAANAETAEFAAACARHSAAGSAIDPTELLAHSGARETARDIDVLRAALGEESLSIIGYWYGAQVALTFAAQHPDRVRALLLDSPSVPTDTAEPATARARAAQAAFDDFAVWCAAGGTCPLGNDPAAALANYQALVGPLLDQPMPLQADPAQTLTFDDAVLGTLVGLSRTENRTQLAVALSLLGGGTPGGLRQLADQGWGLVDGEYPFLDGQSITCIDGTADPTGAGAGAGADQLAVEVAAAAPFMASADPPRGLDSICSSWPTTATFEAPVPPIAGLAPTLVVGFEGDVYSPFPRTTQLAGDLGADLLTVTRTDSGAYLLGGGNCVADVGTEFLLNPPARPKQAQCP